MKNNKDLFAFIMFIYDYDYESMIPKRIIDHEDELQRWQMTNIN